MKRTPNPKPIYLSSSILYYLIAYRAESRIAYLALYIRDLSIVYLPLPRLLLILYS
jgi:hypothetical protein